MDAAAHFGDLGDLDGDDLNALIGEQIDRVVPVRGEQDFPRRQG